jgi:hypothetical protein
MKKEFFTHFLFAIPLFILMSLVRSWVSLPYWLFWVGGVLGTFLPYLDHFIYTYFLAPHELSSQRVTSYIAQKKIGSALDLAFATAEERSKLIFHRAYFQVIFLILTFWVVTSSGSLLGKGLVLAFSLHLIIDQLEELLRVGNLNSWFKEISFIPPEGLDRNKTYAYFAFNLIALLLFGFVF